MAETPNETVRVSDRKDDRENRRIGSRRPTMYVAVAVAWLMLVIRFDGPLIEAVASDDRWWYRVLVGYFALFVCIAWLYGVYNLAVVAFAGIHRRRSRGDVAGGGAAGDSPLPTSTPDADAPAVAVLYTTCDDFSIEAAQTCLDLDYPDFALYVLDDSSDPEVMQRIDRFASSSERVRVVRRDGREGFKAGNLNHALEHEVSESLFVVVDADERLPADFLDVLVPRILAEPQLGFIQANHVCIGDGAALQRDMYLGVDVHWKWYQPLRNRYGFVMFLGHGAIIRRAAWEAAGGFPTVVSEDLAFAIEAREQGYTGSFAEDVVCEEEFPETVRAFRRRHVKWSRGTAQFLHRYFWRLVRSRRISTTEKLDILFPTVNLPLTLLFFCFMLIAGAVLPLTAGQVESLTVDAGPVGLDVPVFQMPDGFDALHRWDLYLVTLVTILSPVAAFVLDLWRQPLRLGKFLVQSTALYATLAPLTAIAIVGYVATRKADFIVTGAHPAATEPGTTEWGGDVSQRRRPLGSVLATTDPDDPVVRGLELVAASLLVIAAILTLQPALLGLGLGYALVTHMHRAGWDRRGLRPLTWCPAGGIVLSTTLGSASLVGVQPALFGFAMFHF